MTTPNKNYESSSPQDTPLRAAISTTELITQLKRKLDPNITHTPRS
jgi:hypothetical protein